LELRLHVAMYSKIERSMELEIHYPFSVSTVLLQASVLIIVDILKIINFIYIFLMVVIKHIISITLILKC
jgi:hypothetical protein